MSEAKRRSVGRPAGATKASGGHSQSLVRGLTLLEYLSASPLGLALSELAEMADLAPSTTHRLLQALQSQGFVTQESEQGLWRIDVKTSALVTVSLKLATWWPKAARFCAA